MTATMLIWNQKVKITMENDTQRREGEVLFYLYD